jgi:signal transduction histidine kinase
MQPLKVIILGAGRGGTALIDLFAKGAGVEIVGVADANPDAQGLKLAAELNIPTTTNPAELVSRDGANLIVDVTGDPRMAAQIAAAKPPEAEVLSGTSARLLWTLVQKEQTLRAQLMQADKLATLGTFAAQIAHDLKNPLYCIREFAQFIEEEEDPARIKEYSGEILKADKYLASIVDNLMAYARGGDSARSEPVRVAEALDQAVTMARYATSTNDIELIREYSAVPALDVDRAELLQVFVNLVTNAAQAMNGKGRLTLTVKTEGTDVLTAVQDNGRGIATADLPKIFTPFFTTKETGVGTGLGLSIVDTIVRKYGGRVDVESREGHGARFTLRFPVAQRGNQR